MNVDFDLVAVSITRDYIADLQNEKINISLRGLACLVIGKISEYKAKNGKIVALRGIVYLQSTFKSLYEVTERKN